MTLFDLLARVQKLDSFIEWDHIVRPWRPGRHGDEFRPVIDGIVHTRHQPMERIRRFRVQIEPQGGLIVTSAIVRSCSQLSTVEIGLLCLRLVVDSRGYCVLGTSDSY